MKVFLDTETTGLEPGQIAQISYIISDDDLNIQKAENIYFKVKSMEPKAQSVHGLSIEKLESLSEGKSFADHSTQILDDINQKILICHNVPFDYKFLNSEFVRCGIEYDPKKFCTMNHYTNLCGIPNPYRPGYKWPRLEETLDFLSIEKSEVLKNALNLFGNTTGFHDSRFDSMGLFMIYKEGIKRGFIQ
ncbi:Exonuclease, RNase T and DNA polymerase III [Methanococcus maripaludis C5]|uniref:Exonuclease, RNase T and DNA polymerase III n=2 Tax=Methanococcus maripaludis TaxID=39152 RepID=A4FZ25_METM5|nr:3'-5' exonuclease [Methanococcus maripaludis]ABO35459.1 Exonuclease, RNase T and DNA polymerase III [Methanococcus maripaludis C5]MBA2861010.1 DNA polymerase III epsilon subunit-like protein [Methanococcus maripaludis]